MADVAVVGAGIAGVACARELRSAGADVRVLERGRVAGGRMATRGLWDRRVDLGASYFTVSDPTLAALARDWSERGLAHEWTDTFCVIEAGEVSTKTGPTRWGATHGLRSLVEDLATGLVVDHATVHRLADLPERTVVLAMPDPQARRIVGEHPVAAVLDREWEPVLAVAARWSERTWDGSSPTSRFDGAFVHDDPVLDWIADDGRRRADDAPVLVAHSGSDLAGRHLEDPAAAVPTMVGTLRRLLDLAEPEDTFVHRWTFARPAGEREQPYAVVEGDQLVGVCGDGWGASPKVETAYVSGRRLGRELARRL